MNRIILSEDKFTNLDFPSTNKIVGTTRSPNSVGYTFSTICFENIAVVSSTGIDPRFTDSLVGEVSNKLAPNVNGPAEEVGTVIPEIVVVE